MSTIEQRLIQLGIVLPAASDPAAQYENCVIVTGFYIRGGINRKYTIYTRTNVRYSVIGH
ncbi:hypothetical protein [Paenibacillus sp. NEAU-GSW1]|uniref:hypothetical protein n=1 Tax=Paenibacillus sp. NEAU-GSW1 TaxID=2682486 RepID=UPI001C12AC32|nr:hypothetical protein [Paenibacillus sp. NEAU-GSW1]